MFFFSVFLWETATELQQGQRRIVDLSLFLITHTHIQFILTLSMMTRPFLRRFIISSIIFALFLLDLMHMHKRMYHITCV